MDRRQQKTRAAIFSAFNRLLAKKRYGKITVQEIIDLADVGRTTFYSHFETKDDLLKALCQELFGHILGSASDCAHTHGLYSDQSAPESVFCHLLQHLQENEHNILGLLENDDGEVFLRYFKNSLAGLVEAQLGPGGMDGVPRGFLVNHISCSFVEMVLWWIKGGMKESPEELDRYFQAVLPPAPKTGQSPPSVR